jgi:hypothetical protein
MSLTYGEVPRPGVQAASGQLQILRAQGVENVGHREVVGAQFAGVHQHVNLALGAAHDGHFAHALGVFQAALDLLVGDQGDVAQRARRRHRNPQNRRGVRVELLHHRHLGRLRQVVDNQVDLVLHFLRRHVAILGQQEGDDHLRLALRRDGADLVHHADGVDRVLYLLADFGFDFLRRSARIGDHHQHRGDVDLGV